MNNKVIYAIAAVVILVAAGVVVYSKTNKNSVQETVEKNQNDQPNIADLDKGKTVPENNQNDPCTDATQRDANGRFKPSVDIANKTAVLETSMGKIELSLYDKDAPKTVQNFVCLINKGFYDGIKFHRVSHGFVIQAGDPTGTGAGGDSIYGSEFEDELYPDTASYKEGYIKGTLAMANRGPNTNTSQFFIMLGDLDLPHNYTIFGKVKSGMDVVEKIGAVPVTPQLGPEDGAPVNPITINKATIK